LFASAFTTAWICTVLWGVSYLWPRGRAPLRHETVKALKFWTIFICAGAVIGTAYRALPLDFEPLIDLRPHLRNLPPWLYYTLAPFILLCIYDFFNYWMHRAQHKWFWKQHRIHHSVRNLSALNSYFHPTEHIFRIVMIMVPLGLVFGGGAAGFGVAVAMLNTAQGYYVHAPTRFNYGPFRAIMVDNAFHRVHHSIEHRHFDKNFGAFTTLWDRLFGTAYWPAKDEWPETGVHDFAECETMGEYLTMRSGQTTLPSREIVYVAPAVDADGDCAAETPIVL
jgi:sterol desaturase/sphingolipid hydroxylase (fatty acid hydroxylase superfamily)